MKARIVRNFSRTRLRALRIASQCSRRTAFFGASFTFTFSLAVATSATLPAVGAGLAAMVEGVLDFEMLPNGSRHLRESLYLRVNAADKAADRAWLDCATVDDVRARQKDLREKMIAAIGGLPERTPLNAQTVATVKGDGYVLEKVLFESMPGFHVTADLFLPDSPKFKPPYPGVVQPCGHSDNGKLLKGYHRAAMLGALNGFATLVYDPVCQGERAQRDWDGKSPTVDEHNAIGRRAILLGWSTARFRVWDGIRAIDYLTSRPEVDASRIGATGISGGGTMTSYLMALDDRVKAAAPGCYISALRTLFMWGGPQDAEQDVFGQLAFGLNHAALCMMHFPSPTCLLLTESDGFSIDGSLDTYDAAKAAYAKFGFGDCMAYITTTGGHGWHEALRHGSYEWMASRLGNGRKPFAWSPLRRLDNFFENIDDKACALDGAAGKCVTPEGTINLPGERTAYEIMAGEAARLAAARPERLTPEIVLKAARMAQPGSVAVQVKSLAPVATNGFSYVRRLMMRKDDASITPINVCKPARVRGAPVLFVNDTKSRKSLAAAVAGYLAEGRTVAVVDLRGFCETDVGPKFYFCEDLDEDLAMLHYHFGESLVAKRAEDLSLAVRMLKDDFGGAQPELHAEGRAAIPAAHAFFTDRVMFAAWSCVRMPQSWTRLFSDVYADCRFADAIHGAYRHYDWIDLVAPECVAAETSALQARIDAAHAAGGGVVSVPAGTHVVGTLKLKDNVELRLEKGCVLEGAADISKYAEVMLDYSEMPMAWHALILAVDAKNVAVTGEGELFGNGGRFKAELATFNRPRGMIFLRAKGVRISDMTLRDTAAWGCYLKECDDVVVERMKIDNHVNCNNDGIDIESRNVRIVDCDVDAGDDGICLKSDNPNFVVENVVVSNCVVRSSCGALKLGTATHGTCRNIRFADCTVDVCRRGTVMPVSGEELYRVRNRRLFPGSVCGYYGLAAIHLDNVDGGTVEDIAFDGIDVKAVMVPVCIRAGSRFHRTFAGVDCKIPYGDKRIFRNVAICNLKARAMSATASSITGVELCRVKDVRLENCDIVCRGAGELAAAAKAAPVPECVELYPDPYIFGLLPASGFYVRHADNVVFDQVNVTVEGDDCRELVVTEDATLAVAESDRP